MDTGLKPSIVLVVYTPIPELVPPQKRPCLVNVLAMATWFIVIGYACEHDFTSTHTIASIPALVNSSFCHSMKTMDLRWGVYAR